jgi:hypothetical protein
MAFVLVQHLDPKHHSMLTEVLARKTAMGGEEDEEDKDTLHQVFKWLYGWNFRTVVQQLELC